MKYLSGLPTPSVEDFETPEKTLEFINNLIGAIKRTLESLEKETKKLIDDGDGV
jgi:hypothetical protein